MICIHHNKDLDGYASGAIVKLRHPDCKLIGWDYAEPLPDIPSSEDVIMIDITFKLDEIFNLRRKSKSLTIIDHHIGIRKDWEASENQGMKDGIVYVYENGKAACEIGWKYLFPAKDVPYAITLLGRYDTWRQKEGDWENETLPFQMAMRLECNSPETFNPWLLEPRAQGYHKDIVDRIRMGKSILQYQRRENEKYARASFERNIGGLRAICLNSNLFSSQVFDSVWDEEKYDVMLPFAYVFGKWKCSLYTTKNDIDCSELAKARGGGGHKQAAGFEVDNFEDIFK